MDANVLGTLAILGIVIFAAIFIVIYLTLGNVIANSINMDEEE